MHEYLDWGNFALIVFNFMLWTFSLEDVNFWVAVSGAALTIITNLFRISAMLMYVRKISVGRIARLKKKTPAEPDSAETSIDDEL